MALNAVSRGLAVIGSSGSFGDSWMAYSTSSTTKRKKTSSKNSRKRNSRRRGKQKQPYTAGKGKDRSTRRIRYTKNNQPYVILASGKARFISKKSAALSKKRKGGKY